MYQLGLDPAAVYDSVRDYGINTPGVVVCDDKGDFYQFFKANADVGQYQAVELDESYVGQKLRAGNTSEKGSLVGIPQVAVPKDSYAWALVKGNGQVVAGRSCPANAKLYSGAADGVLNNTAASHHRVEGIHLTTAVPAAADETAGAPAPCVVHWPHISL